MWRRHGAPSRLVLTQCRSRWCPSQAPGTFARPRARCVVCRGAQNLIRNRICPTSQVQVPRDSRRRERAASPRTTAPPAVLLYTQTPVHRTLRVRLREEDRDNTIRSDTRLTSPSRCRTESHREHTHTQRETNVEHRTESQHTTRQQCDRQNDLSVLARVGAGWAGTAVARSEIGSDRIDLCALLCSPAAPRLHLLCPIHMLEQLEQLT